MKTCIACGMPMKTKEEFAMGDETKDYCIHCAKPDGTMQSYEEKLESMAGFIIKTQGLDKDVAKNVAKEMLSKLPAWKN
ncbi:Putative zinc ribbon domain-containing protein [Clostridium cavendishii DSM 21758]|uniref:Putative zinc ribbon domain-containing protein n=1 Tax=Clostridium cavendishii DSM 21758 TaxID=1121302 RepID=A0A1M6ISF9_9CLOT|nr:zinc ribbon domain-containing protein [Clostridium cavendishii]SHJ37317.1 Putative zinc ribbon domain-containing protein [Clostridium cavendishii DSM 21758]